LLPHLTARQSLYLWLVEEAAAVAQVEVKPQVVVAAVAEFL
jgi:hypothetical protein